MGVGFTEEREYNKEKKLHDSYKNEFVHSLFPLGGRSSPQNFSVDSSSLVLFGIVSMIMAIGESLQLRQQLPRREKHLWLQQLGECEGNEVKHGVSMSAKTCGQTP